MTWCYLCGTSLPDRKSPSWKSEVRREHVVPRGILRFAPDTDNSAWPLALDVHGECDVNLKRHADQLTKVIAAINSLPAEHWEAGDVDQVQAHFQFALGHAQHGPVPLIQNTDKGMVAVAYWIRGFHAALYNDLATCPSVSDIYVRPPGLGFISKPGADIGALIEEENQRTEESIELMRHAIRARRIDEIIAWNGHLHFRCTWYAPEPPASLFKCLWTLDLPGSAVWSTAVRGASSPWYGWFSSASLPRNASVFSNDHLRLSNARYLIPRLLTAAHHTSIGTAKKLPTWYILHSDDGVYVYQR